MKTFELQPINGRKSFYGKCFVLETPEGDQYLKSYNTTVAVYTKEGTLQIENDPKLLSNTTITHINSFLNFHGFKPMKKKEILKNGSSYVVVAEFNN